MRVMHVIQEMGVGGAERIVLSLARAAVDAGHDVALVAAPGPLSNDAYKSFELPMLLRRPGRVPGAARRLSRAISEWKPDVVHAHNPAMGTLAGMVALRGRRVPALVTLHGSLESDYRATVLLLRAAGPTVVACGPGVEAGLRNAGFLAAERIDNGVDSAPTAMPRSEVDELWPAARGRRLLVSAGRLTPVKNQALAIRATGAIPGAALLVLGDGPLRGDLERLVEDEGLRDRIVLAGARTDARALIGAADLVLLPSHSEGLPLAALESWAASVALVATSVSGTRELLEDGMTALLVPDDDARALSAAVRRLLGDDELRNRLACAGHARSKDFSVDRMGERYLGLYERITS